MIDYSIRYLAVPQNAFKPFDGVLVEPTLWYSITVENLCGVQSSPVHCCGYVVNNGVVVRRPCEVTFCAAI